MQIEASKYTVDLLVLFRFMFVLTESRVLKSTAPFFAFQSQDELLQTAVIVRQLELVLEL